MSKSYNLLSITVFLFVISFFIAVEAEQRTSFAVFGYAPEYRYSGIDWNAVAPHVTHMILFSLEISTQGEIVATDRFPTPEIYERVLEARAKHGMKVLLCFGGNSRSNGFSRIVQSSALRTKFLSNLLVFLKENHLDGVDYNWEYPQTQGEWSGLLKLVTETRNAIASKGGIVTMAFYPGQESVLSQGFTSVVDYFHMMTYDQSGKHSTKDFAIKSTVDALKYLPKEKLSLGLPFYSRHTRNGEPKTYQEMVQMTLNLSPEVDEINNYYFNGFATIKKKTEFALKQELGGVMIWEVGQDIHPSERFSLLAAITEARNEFKPAHRRGSDDEL